MEQLNKRQLQAQSTRDAIYAAVNALVEEMPFEDIRIQDVCTRAGISLGSFYHYFSSKGDLMRDRYHRSNLRITEIYEQELAGLHAVDGLKQYLTGLAEYSRTRLVKILRPYHIARIENAERWEAAEKPMEPGVLNAILDRGFAQGELSTAFTREEIRHFVECVCQGLVAMQCKTYGAFLQDDSALAVALDTLEHLRAK